jgi:hypothetical protein
MEYTDYYVVKGTPANVRKQLAKVSKKGWIVDGAKTFVPFVVAGKTDKLPKTFDWLLRVFDAEDSAWGFTLWIGGKQIADATYGENDEWGISEDDNGFEGDEAATAKLLGTTPAKLTRCLNERGAAKFCRLVGFEHQYLLYPHEKEMKPGITVLGEDAD